MTAFHFKGQGHTPDKSTRQIPIVLADLKKKAKESFFLTNVILMLGEITLALLD